jgi:hypothetical protein
MSRDATKLYRKRNRKKLGIAYAFLEQWVTDMCPYCDPSILNMFLMMVDNKYRDYIIKRQSELLLQNAVKNVPATE